jgi:hypothetical protein
MSSRPARLDLAGACCPLKPKKNGQKIAGVYSDNPKREAATSRAETLLHVFKNICLTTIHIAGKTHHYITPLTAVQKQILAICELRVSLYNLLPTNLSNLT